MSYNIGIQKSYKYIHQVRYEPHLSDKARCSEASRFSITKIWYAYAYCVNKLRQNVGLET